MAQLEIPQDLMAQADAWATILGETAKDFCAKAISARINAYKTKIFAEEKEDPSEDLAVTEQLFRPFPK